MTKSLKMKFVEGKPGKVYYPLTIEDMPSASPGPHELQITMLACALNHRDLFLRQALYPAPSFDTPLLSDGLGVVTGIGSAASSSWLNKNVILTPGRNWDNETVGPPQPPAAQYAILGGTKTYPLGTAQEILCVSETEVEEAPTHLNDAEAAAIPLTGLTAWRALVTKAGPEAAKNNNVLITGIGGGVALMTLMFAVARGCKVWVTSGSTAKIEDAKKLGAAGGVNYKTEGWEKQLVGMLPEERKWIDSIIDGAGGDIIGKAVKIIKNGGVICQYGMTINPKMDWTMNAVLKNVELKGSTMGSRKEFREMIEFVRTHKVKPVVSKVVKGIDNIAAIDGLFEEMKNGSQFGKLVIEIKSSDSSNTSRL